MEKKLYKIVFQEIESYTAFVMADSADKARTLIYTNDIDSRSNQDFEQIILDVSSVRNDEYPIGIIINE